MSGYYLSPNPPFAQLSRDIVHYQHVPIRPKKEEKNLKQMSGLFLRHMIMRPGSRRSVVVVFVIMLSRRLLCKELKLNE